MSAPTNPEQELRENLEKIMIAAWDSRASNIPFDTWVDKATKLATAYAKKQVIDELKKVDPIASHEVHGTVEHRIEKLEQRPQADRERG